MTSLYYDILCKSVSLSELFVIQMKWNVCFSFEIICCTFVSFQIQHVWKCLIKALCYKPAINKVLSEIQSFVPLFNVEVRKWVSGRDYRGWGNLLQSFSLQLLTRNWKWRVPRNGEMLKVILTCSLVLSTKLIWWVITEWSLYCKTGFICNAVIFTSMHTSSVSWIQTSYGKLQSNKCMWPYKTMA